MREFFKKILLFISPLVILILPAVFILWGTGENFKSMNKTLLSNQEYLIGYAYNENNLKYLKWYYLSNAPKNDVVALGSSRVLQLRKNSFDARFYNAGYSIKRIDQFIDFLRLIPSDKYPDYLIVSLDQWMFNAKRDPLADTAFKDEWTKSFNKFPDAATIINVYEDLIKKKYSFGVVNNPFTIKLIGLNARLNSKGIRNDGSYFYGRQIALLLDNNAAANDFNFNNTKMRIEKGVLNFQTGNQLNTKALYELDAFLAFCKTHHIFVIAILPPFPEEIYQLMNESGKYDYLNKLDSEIKPLFDAYGFELYNYTHITQFDYFDKEFLDGFHGGEKIYLQILIDILQNNSQLNHVSSLEKLQSDLKNRKSAFNVY